MPVKVPVSAPSARVVSAPAPVSQGQNNYNKPSFSRPTVVNKAPVTNISSVPIRRTEVLNKPTYEATCSLCNNKTTTTFVPDGVRPIYCKNCLSKRKEEKRVELENRQQAKKEERQNFIEIKEEVQPKVSLSLSDLNNLAPVDFKGRTMRVEKKVNSEQNIISGQTNLLNSEHDLKEGEEIKFNN